MKKKGAQALFNALKAKGYKKRGSEVNKSAPKMLMKMAKDGMEIDMSKDMEMKMMGKGAEMMYKKGGTKKRDY
jgi:hypothetical protein